MDTMLSSGTDHLVIWGAGEGGWIFVQKHILVLDMQEKIYNGSRGVLKIIWPQKKKKKKKKKKKIVKKKYSGPI